MNHTGTRPSRTAEQNFPELELGSERRTFVRRSAAVPLKLRIKHSGLVAGSSSVLACTLDLNASGARLMTAEAGLSKGQIVMLQRGQERADFEVIWVAAPDSPKAGQIGVRALSRCRLF